MVGANSNSETRARGDGRHVVFRICDSAYGKRVDVILLIGQVIFVLEFKVGDREYSSHAIDQVVDYALDLKNFHESSHDRVIAPILVSTRAALAPVLVTATAHNDKLLVPLKTNGDNLATIINDTIRSITDLEDINTAAWEAGRYRPTRTIIEAAMALYNGHSVTEISRSDASGA